MSLSKIVQESVLSFNEQFMPSNNGYKDGGLITEPLTILMEEASKHLISSQISLLEAELERKKGMIRFTRDMKSTWNNEIIQEDITYLEEQIEECRKLLK